MLATELSLNESKQYIVNNINLQLSNNSKNISSSILFLSGKPGTGKSSLVEQIVKELDYSLNVKYMSTMLIEQISGLPIPPKENDVDYKWSRSELVSENNLRIKSSKNNSPVILFLDDAHLCSKSIQSYMFQLLTYKSIHDHKLENNVVIIMAGNNSLDKAGATPILSPIVNRICFINIVAEATDWLNHFAISYGVRQDIISFIELYPDLLQSEPTETIPFASPRSWTHYSDSLTQLELIKKLDIDDYLVLGKGHIGLEYASKFSEYIQLFTKWDAKSFLSGQIPLPDFKTLSKIENYTFMSSLIAELLKDLRSEKSDKLRPESEIKLSIVKVVFNQLVDSCKEIIPLGLRTLVCNKSSIHGGNTLIYYKLIDNNPVLLEVAKKLLSVKTK